MELIEIQQDGPVRTVTINRPEKSNAMTSDMLIRFHDAFKTEPNADERVTVTVLLPDGKEVLIEPKPRLKPLPVLEGYVPAGWKDALYGGN